MGVQRESRAAGGATRPGRAPPRPAPPSAPARPRRPSPARPAAPAQTTASRCPTRTSGASRRAARHRPRTGTCPATQSVLCPRRHPRAEPRQRWRRTHHSLLGEQRRGKLRLGAALAQDEVLLLRELRLPLGRRSPHRVAVVSGSRGASRGRLTERNAGESGGTARHAAGDHRAPRRARHLESGSGLHEQQEQRRDRSSQRN